MIQELESSLEMVSKQTHFFFLFKLVRRFVITSEVNFSQENQGSSYGKIFNIIIINLITNVSSFLV